MTTTSATMAQVPCWHCLRMVNDADLSHDPACISRLLARPSLCGSARGFAGAGWLVASLASAYASKPRKCDPPRGVSAFGVRAANLLGEWFAGLYHFEEWQDVDWANPRFVTIKLASCHNLATYDGDALTRLVLLAHRECIRVEIAPCSYRNLEIMLHSRERTDEPGSLCRRHPDLHEMLERFSR